MIATIRVVILVLCGLALFSGRPAHAQAVASDSEVAWRLLDYLAVDYPAAVQNGQVISSAEYAEMVEFAASAETRIAGLPTTRAKLGLLVQARDLRAAIDAKEEPTVVGTQARALAAGLLVAYPTALPPTSLPDQARAAALYADNCSACHGATGRGDGPAAVGMEPAPVAFSDRERARERSVFGLYQVVQQGLEGTAMASFSAMPASDQWALAFYVSGLSYSDADVQRGEALWKADPTLRDDFPDLRAITGASQAQLALRTGDADAAAVMAYLRAHPDAVGARSGDGKFATARARIAASVVAYRVGDRSAANDLALSAYLDGFEPLEPVLSARDPALMRRVETAMARFRGLIREGAPLPEAEAQATATNALLDEAEGALASSNASAASSFAGAFTILLREGLEALLIIVAILAFLKKAERPEVAAYVHGGWIAALLAGGVTWAAATHIISISGASRELTEGFGSLFAALVLVSVGIWMHGKSQADAWQTYIRDKMSKALSRRSAWFLFLLAFLVVYREVFETILFLVALWSQGGGWFMVAGMATAVVMLAVIAFALTRYSRRLPIGQFFSFSAILLSVLAVVLAGKGVSGLQEAGLVALEPLTFVPRIDLLGLYPTWQTVGVQLAVALTLIIGFRLAGRPQAKPASA